MVPFYDKGYNIKGSQIVKIYAPNSKEKTLKIINLNDQDQNNIYTRRSDYL